jgi:transposase-like protein
MGAFVPRYSEERKAAVLNKLLPPQNRTVVSVAAEEGISDVTLYSWLKQCRQRGMPVPGVLFYTQVNSVNAWMVRESEGFG